MSARGAGMYDKTLLAKTVLTGPNNFYGFGELMVNWTRYNKIYGLELAIPNEFEHPLFNAYKDVIDDF